MEAIPLPTPIQLHPADPAPADTPVLGRSRRERPASARPVVRPIHRWYLPVKDAADFVAALVLGLIALPLIAVSALVVKLTSRGPAFYSQTASAAAAGYSRFTRSAP